MKNINEIIASLNVARSNDCSKEKSEEFKSIIKELLPYGELEQELGLPLKVWVYLIKKEFIEEERIYVENSIDNENEKQLTKKVNGRPQRFILGIDFEEKFIQLQGTEEWCEMPFKDYGKTWALTKEELL